jgi:WhiB family redox-sensing transcriptional regulator
MIIDRDAPRRPGPPAGPRLAAVADTVSDRPAWQRQANCRGCDPALFYPGRGETSKEAKAVCDGCVVRADCAEFGLHERFGVWGGLSERERRRIRARRAPTARAS